MTTYRPPRDCPVCQSRLQLTQLGCPTCDTALSGRFEQCSFCGLSDSDLDVLRVFLASRGNMKDLERHLGVSYPTARARFDELLGRLGLLGGVEAAAAAGARSDDDDDDDIDRAPVSDPPAPAAPAGDPRRATLEALARGDIDVDAARDAIAPTPSSSSATKPARGRRR